MNARSNALKNLTWLFAVLLPPCAVGQIPDGWEIVEIFPAGTEFYCGRPDINDRGQVVFHRRLWPSLTDIEIFLYDRGKLVQLTDDDVYDSFPRINNHGVAVWVRDLSGNGTDTDIVLWREGSIQPVANEPYYESSPDINDVGQIVWNGRPDPSLDQSQIFFLDSLRENQITNDAFVNQGARINSSGRFVFTRYDFSISPWISAILAYFDGRLKPLTSGPRQVQSPHLNDVPQVVWTGDRNAVLEVWESGQTRQLVPMNAIAGGINNRTEIAVTRWDAKSRNYTLWLLRDGNLTQITDGTLGGGAGEINQRGEIAFVTGRVPSIGVALLTKHRFRADLDFDGDVDLYDFGMLQRCFDSHPILNDPCASSDINNDDQVDSSDVDRFVEWFGGPE